MKRSVPDAPDADAPAADPQLAGENNPSFDPRTGRDGPNPDAPEPIARRMGRDRVVEPGPGRRGPDPSDKA
jgi:hypothetical protein